MHYLFQQKYFENNPNTITVKINRKEYKRYIKYPNMRYFVEKDKLG